MIAVAGRKLASTRFIALMVSCVLMVPCVPISVVEAQGKPALTEPQVDYFLPIGGNQGTLVEVQIEGRHLNNLTSVWVDCAKIQAKIKRVEPTELMIRGPYLGNSMPFEDTRELGQRVFLELTLHPDAEVGGHMLRLVAPNGISNPFSLRVNPRSEPVVAEVESQTSQADPVEAQRVSVPMVVNGRISKEMGGEVDYYAFDALPKQHVVFEIFNTTLDGSPIRDQAGEISLFVELYELSGSWFDAQRLTRLAINHDSVSGSNVPNSARSRLSYQFDRKGRYLVAVTAFNGQGGPEYTYQLRVASADTVAADGRERWPMAHSSSWQRWLEREFTRKIGPKRLETLWTRTARGSAIEESPSLYGTGSAPERKTRGQEVARSQIPVPATAVGIPLVRLSAHPKEPPIVVPIPSLLEGVIENPRDVEGVRLKVKDGQSLAFEIETPEARPPVFNPWMRVFDSSGQELFSNIYKRVEGNNVMLQNYLKPKLIYTFPRGGEYLLQVRDLTTRYGDPIFKYRLLIRPQIPHVGELRLTTDRLNLIPGVTTKLVVTTEREEGFEGDLALSVENLPSGIQVLPGNELQPDRPPVFDEGEKDRFLPKSQRATILLVVSPEAPATGQLQMVRVIARPVVQGELGPPLLVGEIPAIVVQHAAEWALTQKLE